MCSENIGEKVKILLQREKIKRSYLAKKMGISYNTLTYKLNNKREFSALELTKIINILNLNKEIAFNIIFNNNYKIEKTREV